MKRRITVRLCEPLFERLEAAASRHPGASKTGLVEAALHFFLSSDTRSGRAIAPSQLDESSA
jgi:hypothetical protein